MENALSSERTTLSFYRYVTITDPALFRDQLVQEWAPLGVLGRTYVANEGINAQVSVPSQRVEAFQSSVRRHFPDIPFKIALEEADTAFVKLKVKVRNKLVADGLDDASFDPSDVGEHLDAKSFHNAMQEPGTIVVDMRNHYECEIGHFRGALLPRANTFRDALPEMLKRLEGQEDKQILLYCTGGIRCEKASAYFRYKGFKAVKQLHGGIIDYAHQVKREGLNSEFIGKNFVFDQRMSERITDDVIAHCHQCGAPCDEHVNCAYQGCNRLFIQCVACSEAFDACCSKQCQEISHKPEQERIAIQQAWDRKLGEKHYWSRTRLPEQFAQQVGSVWEPFVISEP